MSSFDFESVEHFVVGAIGMPGSRTFYFQVKSGSTIVSFKCEKTHVAVFVEALGRLEHLAEPEERPGDPGSAGSAPEAAWAPLDLPVLAEWDVGMIGLGYDSSADLVLVELNEVDRSGGTADPDTLDALGRTRARLTRAQVNAIMRHGAALVEAGRPTCNSCGAPIDPDGFNCACFN